MERPRQTFPAGTYELQLLAEFSAYHEGNIVSRYPVGTSLFQVLFTGPEGNFGFTSPPISTQFTAFARFGLAIDTPVGQRFFTQDPKAQRRIPSCPDFPETSLSGVFSDRLKTTPVIRIFRCSVAVKAPCTVALELPVCSSLASSAEEISFDATEEGKLLDKLPSY